MSNKDEGYSPDTLAILQNVSKYYSDKIDLHGLTPQGVDWNGERGQHLRFLQLCRIINNDDEFSVNDLGCGYGALYEYLSSLYTNFSYLGLDVSERMIEAAKQSNKDNENSRFIKSSEPEEVADYGIASGIFNVRLNCTESDWFQYIVDTLDKLNNTSKKGFSCNFLTSYSDEEKKRPDLYYANPAVLFDLCKRRYSKNIALLHDYDLYEFTMIVRK